MATVPYRGPGSAGATRRRRPAPPVDHAPQRRYHRRVSDTDRAAFVDAAEGLVELAGRLRPGDWERPGLGVWDVRALVGHASRSLTTIEEYLGQPAVEPWLADAVEYFLATRAFLAGDTAGDEEERARRDLAIAERGRQAGRALGEDPVTVLGELADRVTALVAETPDEALVATRLGTLRLNEYLPTRTFELAVHSLDLARALELAVPESLGPAIATSLELAARIAARTPQAPEFLLVLTGRRAGDGLSVV